MNARELSQAGGTKTFVLVLNAGDEVTKELLAFSRSRGIATASFTGIGAFQHVTLGYFEPQQR
ncbi:MAG TPA: PPC domain-containing DNA-binding protein, partial [Vicinamibacterales bacterium]|nr:PPC domain-containing DNA-binding protein [Vicinamibacterales bacterium]